MITINLRELAETKGIYSMYRLRQECPSVETGKLLSKSVMSQLWNGNSRKIGLPTIEAVCVGLDCTPSDWIIVSKPDTPKPRSKPGGAGGGPKSKQTAKAESPIKEGAKASRRGAANSVQKAQARRRAGKGSV